MSYFLKFKERFLDKIDEIEYTGGVGPMYIFDKHQKEVMLRLLNEAEREIRDKRAADREEITKLTPEKNMKQFTDEERLKHLDKLAIAFFKHLQVDEFGGFGSIGLDSKRPFGNSYVECDILEIIGEIKPDTTVGEVEELEEYARDLYFNDLLPHIQRKNIGND